MFDVDNTFGPVTAQYFDFTRLFEDSIFGIAPAGALLCLLPFRASWLLRQPRKVSGSPLHASKIVIVPPVPRAADQVILCGLTVLQATCLVLWLAPDTNKSGASIAAAALSLVGAVALCTLSHLEHIHSVTPSPVLNAYLILSLVLDLARLRTAWMRGNSLPLAIAFSIASVIKLVALLAEAIEKRGILLPPYSGYSPESTSGVYSRALFWWLNPLLSRGYRSILDPNDLYPVDIGLRTDETTHQLARVWAGKKGRPSKHGFLWATLYTIRVPLAKAIVPRLCVTFFQYMQPFLISAVIKFLQGSGTADSDRVGWALTGAYGLDFIGIAIANGVYMHQTYRMVTVSRAALISVIYSQTVDLNLASVDESAAVTLMSADVERISSAFQYIHGLWASPLDAMIGAYLLQRRIGLAAIGPALLSVSFGSVVLFVAIRYAPKAQRLWVGCIQTRIDATSKTISGMKAVKILGLAPVMHRLIKSLREQEVKAALRFRRISVLRLSFGKGSEILAPGIAFAMYFGVRRSSGQPLDVDTAYASLNIITLMTVQLGETIQNLPTIMSAISCFDRIQDFLDLPSRRDQRLVKEVAPQATTPPSQERSSGYSLELDQLSKAGIDPSTPVLSLKNVSLSWIKGDEIIKDVTFDVSPHTFCFIVGPAGCGKSTLLKGLVGEVTFSTGFVHSSSSKAGFVDQTPWVQTGTLQHNVLGTAVYEKHWYEAVMYACCLDDDVAAMPHGEHTQVGSAGTNLSGGQKQRLALARAVYSKNSLLLLDDCFSGLDPTTEDRVMIRLFGREGLLRRHSVTVVLVTHAANRWSYADHIAVLDIHGRLVEQGGFQHLMKNGKYLPAVAHKFSKERDVDKTAEVQAGPGKPDTRGAGKDGSVADTDHSRSAGDWTTYIHYFRSCGWMNTICSICGLCSFAVFMRMPDVWITFWTAAVKAKGTSVDGYYLSIFLLFEILSAASLVCTGCLVFLKMTPSSSTRQHLAVLDTVMAAPLSFFAKTDLGITLNRFSQDMNLVDVEMPPGYLEMAAQTIIVTVQAVLMCLSSGWFAMCIPFAMAIMFMLQKFYLRTSRQLRLLDLEVKSPLYSHFVETLGGLVTIRVFGWSDHFEQRNRSLLDASQKPFYLLYCVQRWLGLVLDMTVAGLMVFLMVLLVKLRHTINPGFAGIALVNMSGFSMSLTLLIKAWTMLETSMGAICRVKTFAAETARESTPHGPTALPTDWPQSGRIQIINLSAGYDPGTPVIKGLNLDVPPGQKLGLCGPSGCGKSSVIATILRMLEASSGSVSIDGVDITSLQHDELRMRINTIPQDGFLFKGTVRQNVDPFGRCNDEDQKSALNRVQLWHLLEKKNGLDTVVDLDMFSHGQRQLFSLARALLHPGKIVILDEATSSVDVATEKLMQDIISEEFTDRTIIAVAHRLDTIIDFDRIAVMQDGELVELDTLARLMSQQSAFRALYESC